MGEQEAQPHEDLKQAQFKEASYGAHFGGEVRIFGAPSGLNKTF